MSFTDDIQESLKEGLSPFQKNLQDVIAYLKFFIKNPVQAIKAPPRWEWEVIFVVFVSAAAICGGLAGVVSFRVSQIFVGLIFFPISACAGALILSGFFYYTFLFLYRHEVAYRLIFTIVTLSLLPFFALYTFASLLEPLKLVGFAATAVLLVVGLSENSHIERKKIIQLIVGLYIFYFIFWGIHLIRWQSETKSMKVPVTQESFDQLRKELSD